MKDKMRRVIGVTGWNPGLVEAPARNAVLAVAAVLAVLAVVVLTITSKGTIGAGGSAGVGLKKPPICGPLCVGGGIGVGGR